MKATEVRAKHVEAAVHSAEIDSAEIEGLRISSATLGDADAYVAGTIDSAELVDRVRSRYDFVEHPDQRSAILLIEDQTSGDTAA